VRQAACGLLAAHNSRVSRRCRDGARVVSFYVEPQSTRLGEEPELQDIEAGLASTEIAEDAIGDMGDGESDASSLPSAVDSDADAAGEDEDFVESDASSLPSAVDSDVDLAADEDSLEEEVPPEASFSDASRGAGRFLTVSVFSGLFALALYLLATGAVPLGALEEVWPQGRVALAVVLTLLFAGSVRTSCRRSIERVNISVVADGEQFFTALATRGEFCFADDHPLRDAFETAREVLEDDLTRREVATKKEARVELVRARSDCERLVERYCEQTQESKRQSELALSAERKERELEREEWSSTQQIREAAQRDAEERIARLSEEIARLEGELGHRDENLVHVQVVESEREAALAEARAQAAEYERAISRLGGEVASREEELRKLQGRATELDDSMARFEEKYRCLQKGGVDLRDKQRSFFDKLASNLRGPLQSASHLAETLAHKVGAQEPETAAELEAQAGRLGHLADQVLDLCRVEGGNTKHVYSDVSLERLVKEVIGDLRPAAEEGGIDLSFEVDKDLPSVSIERSLCGKVLRELVSNAVRFCERGTRVWVNATVVTQVDGKLDGKPAGSHVIFEVGDTGAGIPPESQERVFELFEKGSGSIATAEASCGLGLSLARGFVQLLGGELRLESEADKGCRFVVTVPIRVMSERPNY
jgi:signal transduction histidine kinase